MSWIAFELLLLALGWLGVGFFKGYIQQKEDRPEVPQGGGIIFATIWLGLLLALNYQKFIPTVYLWLFLPIVAASAIGFLEDCRRISDRVRLVFQVMAIYISYYLINLDIAHLKCMGFNVGAIALRKMPEWSLLSLIVLGTVAFASIWDRMDKTDGFAAVQSLFVLAVGGFILSYVGAYGLAIVLFGLCALIGGFLIWNWPTNKLVMGKSGTVFLGSLIAILALYSHQWHSVPLEIWFILVMPFCVDATLTALRSVKHYIINTSHAEFKDNHAYQRLLAIGWSPFQVLCALIVLNSFLATLVLWVYNRPEYLIAATCVSLGFVLIIYGLIEYVKPMYGSWYKGAGMISTKSTT